LEADVLLVVTMLMKENHIIVIIRYVRLMRRSISADCYPFHGGRTTTTATTNSTINTIGSSRVADKKRERAYRDKTERSPKATECEFIFVTGNFLPSGAL